MNTNRELFEDAPVSKAVAVMAIPTIITMLVVVIYNMADTFFIGQTNDAMQVAAVSLATPVFMLFMALGNLFGIGGSSAYREHWERSSPACEADCIVLCIRFHWNRCDRNAAFPDWNEPDLSVDRRQ